MPAQPSQHLLLKSARIFFLMIVIIIVAVCVVEVHNRGKSAQDTTTSRTKPEHFPPGTNMPEGREGKISGSIDLSTFSPGRDLIRIDDDRVKWESDTDSNDTEDDHTIHRSMEAPLRRLIDMVDKEGGILSVRDTYRPSGIHNPTSLHKEGRAVDLTCENLSLEELARLCWIAGFDWVLYEKKNAHIHASVRR